MPAQARFRYHIRILTTLLSRPPRAETGFYTVATTLGLFAGAGLYWSRQWGADSWIPASRQAVFENNEIWRLATTLFAHADFGHLLSNTFMYVILGYLLCGYFGKFVYPVLAWSLAIPMTAFALLTYPPSTQLIGASGLVHLMGGLWLSLYFCLSRNLRLTQRLLRSGGVMLALFFPTSFEPNVSYRVHFIGLLFGLIAGSVYFAFNRRRLLAFEVVEVEYEPDPEYSVDSQKSNVDPIAAGSQRDGLNSWHDVGELEGAEGLTDADDEWDQEADLDDEFDDELHDDQDTGDDQDTPEKKKPRRLGPGRGHA